MIVIQMTGSQKDQEQYPDLGSNFEIYFDPDMLESEFLSPGKPFLPVNLFPTVRCRVWSAFQVISIMKVPFETLFTHWLRDRQKAGSSPGVSAMMQFSSLNL